MCLLQMDQKNKFCGPMIWTTLGSLRAHITMMMETLIIETTNLELHKSYYCVNMCDWNPRKASEDILVVQ